MSELTNRAAYLKGLADGMKLDGSSNEGKLLSELIDFVNAAAAEIDALDQEQGFIADKIDELEEEVDVIGNEVFDEYCDCDCCCDEEYLITCEACGKEFAFTEDDLEEGEILCPYCGETIEFEFVCDCEEE